LWTHTKKRLKKGGAKTKNPYRAQWGDGKKKLHQVNRKPNIMSKKKGKPGSLLITVNAQNMATLLCEKKVKMGGKGEEIGNKIKG